MRPGSGQLLGIRDGDPAFVGNVHQVPHSRVDGGYHRRHAYGVNLNGNALLRAFLDGRLKAFDFRGARARFGRKGDLPCPFDALRSKIIDLLARHIGAHFYVNRP